MGSSSKHAKESKETLEEKTIEFSDSEDEKIAVKKEASKSARKEAKKVESEPSESDADSDSESDTESDEDESDDESDVSLSTTEILNNDPLYTILSQFFLSKDGKNIADILEEINHKLKYLKVR